MNRFERAILAIAPGWAASRARSRGIVATYEAATPSRLRRAKKESRGVNAAVAQGGRSIREQARHFEQNHDLARGVLDVLVRNTIGTGIGVEPQPRLKGDKSPIHDDFAWQLSKLWAQWCERPEVTWQHEWGSAERLLARSWFRDGEVFAQRILGTLATLDHGTTVPYSLELLEADLIPLDYNVFGTPRIIQGVELNGWNRPIAYHAYRQHPTDLTTTIAGALDLKRLPAERMLHLKCVDRIGQLRGVSVFASILQRLEDLKDYEESERVAAKIAASMAAYIRKGTPDQFKDGTPSADAMNGDRQMSFRAGMIFDDLRPGEDIGTIDTNRPNPNLQPYRQGQLRAAASGTGTTYSSIAKDYNGTYSSQRQELVEGYVSYRILSRDFISRITRPVYKDFVAAALLSRAVSVPSDVDPATIADAVYIPPQMPWIDPIKEAEAWALLEDRCYASAPEIIRSRGASPFDVLDQQSRWLAACEEAGLPAPKPVDGNAGPQPAAEPAE